MPIKVLVVDDEEDKARRVVSLLSDQAGIASGSIHSVKTGVEARRELLDRVYDLVVIDIALPLRPGDSPDRRGGIKLLEEIVERGIYKLPEVVVGLTAFPDLWEEYGGFFRSRLWTLDHYERSDTGWAERLTAKARYLAARSDQRDDPPFKTDVCVIAALNTPELRALRELPWGWSPATSFDKVGFYYEGVFESGNRPRSVIAAAAPRMGMVAAAVLSTKMILKFRQRVLVMVGICAGVKGSCGFGDVLVADPSWDWQTGKHGPKGFSVAPDQIDIPTGIAERFRQLGSETRILFDIYDAFSGAKPQNMPNILVGPVPSGSAVLGNGKLLADIKKTQHGKLLGVEMELYGMYAAARDCPPPSPVAFGVKSVCDFADHAKSDEYQAYAAHVSARVFGAFCERYGVDLLP
jgi:nucleoside phosphorylase/CheY-like chemotaxis protein